MILSHSDCCFDVEEHYSNRVDNQPLSPHRPIGGNHAPRKAIEDRDQYSVSIDLPIWRAH